MESNYEKIYTRDFHRKITKMKSLTIVIDIDGTICNEERTFEKIFAKPLFGVIEIINSLYESGNIIILYTARSWQEYRATKEWLKLYDVKYHELICGKPFADVFIDDRSCKSVEEFWNIYGKKGS